MCRFKAQFSLGIVFLSTLLIFQENPACMKESGGGATLIKVAPIGPEPPKMAALISPSAAVAAIGHQYRQYIQEQSNLLHNRTSRISGTNVTMTPP